MDYEKKYNEALSQARFYYGNCPTEPEKKKLEKLFPELRESEDERIIRAIIDALYSHTNSINLLSSRSYQMGNIEAWLDKHKYDRMKPVYDNQDSFESALGKAWKDYNDSGAITVDGCEDNYVECAHAKGFREGYLFGLEKQKEPKPTDKIDLKFNIGDTIVNKKNGEKCTISNRCLLHQYYSDTNHCHEIKFDEQDDWELVKEQKPNFFEEDSTDFEIEVHEIIAQARNDSRLNDADVLKQFEEEAAFALMLKANKLIEQQKPAEWSEEDEKIIQSLILEFNKYVFFAGIEANKIISFLKSLRPQYNGDVTMTEAYKMGKEAGEASHWKPSEEQMEELCLCIPKSGQPCTLQSLYNDLKKL